MKKLFLFSTKLWYYLVAIPPVFLLVISIIFNDKVKTIMKLYPLIALLSIGIILIFVYFFRGILISKKEIRRIGLFTSRDVAEIKSERTLCITVIRKGRLKVELFGSNTDGSASYAWLKSDSPAQINLFRAKANGRNLTIKRILKYFGIDDKDINQALTSENYFCEYPELTLEASLNETDSAKQFKVKFTK